MIDYIKIALINVDIARLLNIECLEFVSDLSKKTGVISNKSIAEYHFCKIVIYDSGAVFFTGSIHKLWNSIKGVKSNNYGKIDKYNGFNGNQFTITNIFEMRLHLQRLFNCKPHQMVFQNIEFGVNTTPEFNPQKYLKGLLFHRGKLFEYKFNEHFAQVKHQRYFIKVYNKSNQYQMQDYSLRVELKIVKTEDIKQIGIKTFSDINTVTLNKSKELLLKRFNEIVHYDYTIDKKDLTRLQKQQLINYSNPRYWINDLKAEYRDRQKKRLLKITCNNSSNLHKKIAENIIEKCLIINQYNKYLVCND